MTREPMPPLAVEAGLALRCLQDALAVLGRPFAWRIVALVAAGKVLAVAALATYPREPMGDLLAPLLRGIGGNAGPQYPTAYACMPRALSMLDPIVDLAVGLPWIVGLLVALPALLARAGGREATRSRRRGSFPPALVAALPGAVVGVAVAVVGDRISSTFPGRLGVAIGLATTGAGLALASALAYAVPAAALGGKSPAAAWSRSFVLAAEFPRLTFVTLLVEVAITGMFRREPRVIAVAFDALNPESVFLVLGLGAVILAWVEVVRAAMLGRLYLHARGTETS